MAFLWPKLLGDRILFNHSKFDFNIVFLFWFMLAFIIIIRDITNDIELLNVGGASKRSSKIMHERMAKLIQLHSDVKELSYSISQLLEIQISSFPISCELSFFNICRLIDEFNGIYIFITLFYFLYDLLLVCFSIWALTEELVKCNNQ